MKHRYTRYGWVGMILAAPFFSGCLGELPMETARPVAGSTGTGTIKTPQELLAEGLKGIKVVGLPDGTLSSGLKVLNKAKVTWPSMDAILGVNDGLIVEKYAASSVAPVQSIPVDRKSVEYIDGNITPVVGQTFSYLLRVQFDGESVASEKVTFVTAELPKPRKPEMVFEGNQIKMAVLSGQTVTVRLKDDSDNEERFEIEPWVECYNSSNYEDYAMHVGVASNPYLHNGATNILRIERTDPSTRGDVLSLDDAATIPFLLTEPYWDCYRKIFYRIRAVNASGPSSWISTPYLQF